MKEKNLFFKRAMLAQCLLTVCWIPVRADVIITLWRVRRLPGTPLCVCHRVFQKNSTS